MLSIAKLKPEQLIGKFLLCFFSNLFFITKCCSFQLHACGHRFRQISFNLKTLAGPDIKERWKIERINIISSIKLPCYAFSLQVYIVSPIA